MRPGPGDGETSSVHTCCEAQPVTAAVQRERFIFPIGPL